jgi:glutamine amidotransferase
MCLLTFLPADVMPDTTALLNGAYLNDDGHGFAIVTDDHLIVHHGMDAEVIVDAFAAARHAHPHGPALFHSRFGTHGKRTVDNCHPFPVGGDERTVVAHNGVLPDAVQPAKGDPRSDTRIAAEDFLPTFGSLRARRTRQRLQRWMTTHNKMVILTVDRRFKEPAYILNENAGTWDGGIWYSNDGYLPPHYSRWGPVDESAWHWPPERTWGDPGRHRDRGGFGRCGFCHAIIDTFDNECPHCGWCFDCGEMPEDCQCYTPAALTTRPRP